MSVRDLVRKIGKSIICYIFAYTKLREVIRQTSSADLQPDGPIKSNKGRVIF